MTPGAEIQKEVRFAVVLYGGVSLAIYINGVAQELLRMVRATAPHPGDPAKLYHAEAHGSEAVYRELGQILSGCGGRLDRAPASADPVRTRFVVDILSGTSAGGINGVFLAKALARDKSLDALKTLWVEEGDIGLLLNDEGSAMDNIELQEPPRSLLNSQRMFWKLYDAMKDLDEGGAGKSPYADEIDLFVTLTDLNGRLLQLPLTGGSVYERRHRAVMHFHYASAEVTDEPDDQFEAKDTPLLAFAARCTSSFPVAFEPMMLTDAIGVLRQAGKIPDEAEARRIAGAWTRVTSGYDAATPLPSVGFPDRAFADGGYLDNKPFSYAVAGISNRDATLPVERKLLYVEPAPERPEQIAERSRRPDAIENAWLALSTLPRQETIRQDLEEVLRRNEEVERVRGLIRQIEESVEQALADGEQMPDAMVGFGRVSLRPGQWVEMDAPEAFRTFGRAYLAYQSLKISTVSDDLAAVLCRHFEIEHGSSQDKAIRAMVRAWRDREYGPEHIEAMRLGKRDQFNRFLLEFDISYRVRRLRYLRRVIDDLLCGEAELPRQTRAEFLAELRAIARRLRAPFITLRTLAVAAEDIRELGASESLRAALAMEPDSEGAERALEGQAEVIRTAAEKVRARFGAAFLKASREALAAINPEEESAGGKRVARARLLAEFNRFEDYDSMTFPVLHCSGVEELSPVDVTRVSPRDATAIVDERTARRPKLRGTALGNFGAFLDRGWRENDIVWGRLDGAERIITAILPAEPDRGLRDTMIRRAHDAILREEMDRLMPGPEPARERFEAYRERQRREPERDLSVRSLARSTAVIGAMLEKVSKDRRWEGMPFATLTRGGRILWGAVEVATPQSLWDAVFRHWLKLAYLFEIALIAAGVFVPATQSLGVKLLAMTMAAHLGVLLVRDYLVESRRVIFAIVTVVGLAVFVVTLIGALEIWNFFESGRSVGELTARWWLVRLTVISAGLCAVVGGWMAAQTRRLEFPGGGRPRRPVVDLQFARTAEEFGRVAGDWWHPNRRVLRAIQEADAWFVAGYVGLLGGLGGLACEAGDVWRGALAAAAAVAAGGCDVIENRAIEAALTKRLTALGPLKTAGWAAAKFGLAGVSAALLAWSWWAR